MAEKACECTSRALSNKHHRRHRIVVLITTRTNQLKPRSCSRRTGDHDLDLWTMCVAFNSVTRATAYAVIDWQCVLIEASRILRTSQDVQIGRSKGRLWKKSHVSATRPELHVLVLLEALIWNVSVPDSFYRTYDHRPLIRYSDRNTYKE